MTKNQDRLAGVMLSIAAHLAAFLAIVWVAPRARMVENEPPPMVMATVQPLRPPVSPAPPAPTPEPPAVTPPTPAPPKPEKLPPKRSPRPTPRPPPAEVVTLAASKDTKGPAVIGMSDAEAAGASAAGSGGGAGGGTCDMAKLLQTALRKSPRVQAAVGSAHRAASGKAFKVWNGDWVRTQSEDGDGLAILREAMLIEIGFAPAACRNQPVQGLVMFTLNDDPGAARFAVGASSWRWADMLHARGAVRSTAFR